MGECKLPSNFRESLYHSREYASTVVHASNNTQNAKSEAKALLIHIDHYRFSVVYVVGVKNFHPVTPASEKGRFDIEKMRQSSLNSDMTGSTTLRCFQLTLMSQN